MNNILLALETLETMQRNNVEIKGEEILYMIEVLGAVVLLVWRLIWENREVMDFNPEPLTPETISNLILKSKLKPENPVLTDPVGLEALTADKITQVKWNGFNKIYYKIQYKYGPVLGSPETRQLVINVINTLKVNKVDTAISDHNLEGYEASILLLRSVISLKHAIVQNSPLINWWITDVMGKIDFIFWHTTRVVVELESRCDWIVNAAQALETVSKVLWM